MKYIFGPVPSRRLGISLGVDLVPFKTCTFNCIYCQLGRTTNPTLKRKEYIEAKDILEELKEELANWQTGKLAKQKINYITLSGSGEPSLNSKIGEIISGIKKMTSIPVAVLTNGSLLYKREVRNGLKEADLVIPSLDAATAQAFKKINRPVETLKVEKIIRGLVDFRREYKGKIWLEVMLAKGINDGREEIKELKKTIAKIKPDRVQLNTVARPPCEKFARALSNKELERIKNLLGPLTEVIVPACLCEARAGRDFERRILPSEIKTPPPKAENFVVPVSLLTGQVKRAVTIKDLKKGIMTMLKRRPAVLKDLADGLGVHRNEVLKYLALLEKERKIRSLKFRGKRYYQAE